MFLVQQQAGANQTQRFVIVMRKYYDEYGSVNCWKVQVEAIAATPTVLSTFNNASDWS